MDSIPSAIKADWLVLGKRSLGTAIDILPYFFSSDCFYLSLFPHLYTILIMLYGLLLALD